MSVGALPALGLVCEARLQDGLKFGRQRRLLRQAILSATPTDRLFALKAEGGLNRFRLLWGSAEYLLRRFDVLLDRLAEILDGAGRLADACDTARRAFELAESRVRRRQVETFAARLRKATPGDEAAQRALDQALSLRATLAFFESPRRLARTLEQASTLLGDREVVVARELSKLHETLHVGTASELAAEFTAHPPRGECTVLVSA